MTSTRYRCCKVAFYFSILTFTVLSLNCDSQNNSPIKIKSAKRAYQILVGRSPADCRELTPVNPETSVVLDLQIKGISIDEFRNIDTDHIYVMAEGQRYHTSITQSGIILLYRPYGELKYVDL